MRLVVIESPYAGDVEANTAYARRCMAHSLAQGEAPIASHLLYTQPGILDDLVPEERTQGIEAGLAWAGMADAVAFYVDRDWSRGMEDALARHLKRGTTIEIRFIALRGEDAFDAIQLAISVLSKAKAGLHVSLIQGHDRMLASSWVYRVINRLIDGPSDTRPR